MARHCGRGEENERNGQRLRSDLAASLVVDLVGDPVLPVMLVCNGNDL